MYKKIPDRENLYARAAILAAEDELSDIEIAQSCGITRRTLMRWKKQPAIQQKINEHLRLIQLHSEVGMISERQNRVLHLEMKFQDLQGIIRAPAVPSGKKHRAALFIADGTRSDLEIAAACGVNRRTLARWKEQPSFRTRVADARTTVFR